MEEAEKYGHLRLKQEEEKRIAAGGDPEERPDYKLKTLEEEYETYMEKEYKGDYEMVSERQDSSQGHG